MQVIIASHNPAKIRAVDKAFSLQFPGQDIDFQPIHVASGVSDQPLSDAETRLGAQNRARNASLRHPDANYCVGLEGGVEVIDDQLTAFAWMSVLGPGGKYSDVRTVTLPLPPAVRALMEKGLELGEANDRVFSTVNSKQQGGAFGLLTNGLYTREGVYTEALVIALVPFQSPLYQTTQ